MKKLFILFAVTAAGLTLKADVMYWQLTGTSETYGNNSWNTVRVGYYTSLTDATPNDTADGYLYLRSPSNPNESSTSINVGKTQAEGGYFAVLPGNSSAVSYFIELGNYNGSSYTAVAQSSQIAYNAIADYVVTTEQLDDILASTSIATMQAWTGGSSYQAVPEPTGGLMVLVGLSVFALRRRKARV